MPRYYFDFRDEDGPAIDEEGVELRDVEAAQSEAAFAMADAVRDRLRGPVPRPGEIAIEARDDIGRVARVRVSIEMQIERKN